LPKRKVFSYSVYGLNVSSGMRLPGLMTADGDGCDVRVLLNPPLSPAKELEEKTEEFSGTPARASLTVKNVGHFDVTEGSEITVTPQPGVTEFVLGLWIVERAFLPLLYQRGLLALHASAVKVGDASILLLGPSGFGKSSLAAGLHSRGYRFMSDDITGVHPGKLEVLPGSPEMKLFPEMASPLEYGKESLEAHPLLPEKRYYSRPHEFHTSALPLKAIYALSNGTEPKIEPLQPQKAVIELIRSSYGILSLQGIIDSGIHFLQCSQLVKTVPSFRLNWFPSPSTLSAALEMIEEHLETL